MYQAKCVSHTTRKRVTQMLSFNKDYRIQCCTPSLFRQLPTATHKMQVLLQPHLILLVGKCVSWAKCLSTGLWYVRCVDCLWGVIILSLTTSAVLQAFIYNLWLYFIDWWPHQVCRCNRLVCHCQGHHLQGQQPVRSLLEGMGWTFRVSNPYRYDIDTID